MNSKTLYYWFKTIIRTPRVNLPVIHAIFPDNRSNVKTCTCGITIVSLSRKSRKLSYELRLHHAENIKFIIYLYKG